MTLRNWRVEKVVFVWVCVGIAFFVLRSMFPSQFGPAGIEDVAFLFWLLLLSGAIVVTWKWLNLRERSQAQERSDEGE